MKKGGNTNFLVSSIDDAKKLLSDARGNMNKMPRYTNIGYMKGYEVHPSEAVTNNAPHNNLDHLKWKDFSKSAKSMNNCGKGHIFFDSRGAVPPLRKGE
ncbi:hypothetical protein APC04_00585 [Acinetobacter baumannii]|uniref:hypothetical protein n=1 Tax=Acinetobacter baumannii TaxID=470 RepID=UPI0007092663|nr:hypothetical protein [Acinetobacter baumannii]KQF21571.1 hypothetical protein APC04_00585 [Acinetobacter baumannii]